MISYFEPYVSYCKYIGNLAIQLFKWTSIYQCNPQIAHEMSMIFNSICCLIAPTWHKCLVLMENLVKFQSNVSLQTFPLKQAEWWNVLRNLLSKSITTFLMPPNSIISCVDIWEFDAKRCISFCRKTCSYHKVGLLLNIVIIAGYTKYG